jgi:hypothetical protein
MRRTGAWQSVSAKSIQAARRPKTCFSRLVFQGPRLAYAAQMSEPFPLAVRLRAIKEKSAAV